VIPFSEFDPKDWPKTESQPCRFCGAPEVITRHGRAKVRNPRAASKYAPNGNVNKWYWVIGYWRDMAPCTCAGRVEEMRQHAQVMERFNSWADR